MGCIFDLLDEIKMEEKEKSIAFHLYVQFSSKPFIHYANHIKRREHLSIAYTPGISNAILFGEKKPNISWFNRRVAVATTGERILGLGYLNRDASYYLVQGKAILFSYNAVALPLVMPDYPSKQLNKAGKKISVIEDFGEYKEKVSNWLSSQVESLRAGFVNIEDFNSQGALVVYKEMLKRIGNKTFIFWDDSEGTGLITGLAVKKVLLSLEKEGSSKELFVLIFGGGSAGYGIAKVLDSLGISFTVFDSKGVISPSTQLKKEIRELKHFTEKWEEKIKQNNVVVIEATGLSRERGERLLEFLKEKVGEAYAVFSLTNPTPLISKEFSSSLNAKFYATGQSNDKNQINNVSFFPFIAELFTEIYFVDEKQGEIVPFSLLSEEEKLYRIRDFIRGKIKIAKRIGKIEKDEYKKVISSLSTPPKGELLELPIPLDKEISFKLKKQILPYIASTVLEKKERFLFV